MDLEVNRPGSFDDFVTARGRALVRYAYMLTRDSSLAEDVVQNALVKLNRRWRAAAISHPEAYTRRIITNEFLSWRRRRSSGEVPTAAIPEPAQPDDTAEVIARDEIWRMLLTLPRRQQVALVLRYYEDYPDEEIALVLRCRPGTVRSLLSRGLDRLREVITSANASRESLADPRRAPRD
jgi:RNA polymerase sigma-70 factor (sigma-E family)